jgi:hypothetical protein
MVPGQLDRKGPFLNKSQESLEPLKYFIKTSGLDSNTIIIISVSAAVTVLLVIFVVVIILCKRKQALALEEEKKKKEMELANSNQNPDLEGENNINIKSDSENKKNSIPKSKTTLPQKVFGIDETNIEENIFDKVSNKKLDDKTILNNSNDVLVIEEKIPKGIEIDTKSKQFKSILKALHENKEINTEENIHNIILKNSPYKVTIHPGMEKIEEVNLEDQDIKSITNSKISNKIAMRVLIADDANLYDSHNRSNPNNSFYNNEEDEYVHESPFTQKNKS